MNYANLEITKLLPAKNPTADRFWVYSKRLSENILFSNHNYYNWDPAEFNNYFTKLNHDSWNWEEIRLYLASKGWHIPTIKKCYFFPNGSGYAYTVESLHAHSEGYDCINSADSDLYFDTYEEAREAAIIYLLTNKIIL